MALFGLRRSVRCRVGLRLLLAIPAFCLIAASQMDHISPPPCGGDVRPAYPDLEHSPALKVWIHSASGEAWAPPECAGWSAPGFSTLVVTTARFRNRGGVDDLRRRLAAISRLKGVRYWSATGKRWETLILDAYALQAADGARRADFSPGEIAAGKTVYFHQEDNLTGRAAYRLRIRSVSADRLVFDLENATPIRYLLLTLFDAGEAQGVYFLERESADVWRYYGMARTLGNAAGLMAGHEASLINRAAALYRYLAGIPTDQEPPASR